MSDHCPLLVTQLPSGPRRKPFRFESFWPKLPGFLEVVQQSWNKPCHSGNKVRLLHVKLSRLSKALRRWSREQIHPLKLAADIAAEIVRLLDQVQENRPLTAAELALRKKAKARTLGFVTIWKIKIRQRARLTWIKLSDANTKKIQLRANGRRRKNFISSLQGGDRVLTDHQDKAAAIFNHFSLLLGANTPRTASLNWSLLDIPSHDLQHLDVPINQQEIKTAVFQAHSEKAPGPDGYTGLFYKLTWEIINEDLTSAVQQIFNLCGNSLQLLNTANIVLLPKKDSALTPADFRPISLMHSVAKLVTKLLANRLAPVLHQIVSPCQSAFIKGRSIQDNFQYVQGAVNHFHNSNTPMLFLKLDIQKAFDSVRWEYMLELLQRLGFGQRWRDLLSILWGTTSSRILLNGVPGRPIHHRRGLRQGDPLSPMLFILAMDPLQRLFDKATQQGLLCPIGADPIRMRTSLYVHDAALFVRPKVDDLITVRQLLQAFGDATGLHTNLHKSEIYRISCNELELDDIAATFPANSASFPCNYLVLPLHIGRTRRVDEQLLIDKIGARLPGWKGRLLTRAGRLTLINSVLTSIPVYHMTVFPLSKWAIKRTDDFRHGSCLINWR